jgi:hypothetical protein
MRYGHTATRLPDGRVLVVGGGFDDTPLTTAEVWDPATGAFRPAGTLPGRYIGHTATLLPDGRVLIVGGSEPSGGASTRHAAVWDPEPGTFVRTGSLAEARSQHTATLLTDGRVLVVGGSAADRGEAELWDPATGTFTAAGSLLQPRSQHTATLLPDGRVLVIGGVDLAASLPNQDAINLATAETWDAASGSFSAAPSLAEARASHTATLLDDGRVLM